ncbi:hypothetical protein OJF2_20440 [Aquisphaera giovannonii]|uniref:DinB superfamily protein n=1 Tax=Aquisphaera giovannonii TaxID=406548 RepID=A0A5B9VZ00_9BACT|nr:DUF1569 domain-containing protein [Aquisphaera giovannonii]QEH33542.1 hypothetical protein OJF2_20440 [Aquisphaera giovannonii]
MNSRRMTLRFDSMDDIIPEVERLRRGCRTVGTWSLAQICQHLAMVARRVVDMPATDTPDRSQWVPPEQKAEVFRSGRIPEGLPAPDALLPPKDVDLDAAVEALRSALAYFKASDGPKVPHRFFGYLTRDEWEQLQCIHCAHHLSFAIPDATSR